MGQRVALVLSLLGVTGVAEAKLSQHAWPGPRDDGSVLLPNGQTLTPQGKTLPLGSLPENMVLLSGGRWLAVMHGGFGDHEVDLVDVDSFAVADKAILPTSFYGMAAAGNRLFVSGGEDGKVHVFEVADGHLKETGALSLGLLDTEKVLVGGLAVDEEKGLLYAALTFGDAVVAIKIDAEGNEAPASPQRIALPPGSFPYALERPAKSDRLYVSLWGRSSLALVDTQRSEVVANLKTASHPTEMALSPDGKTLYVACANSTTVSVLDTATGAVRQSLATALYPDAPNGNTPNSLALTPDGKLLIVANADANNLAVFNVESQKSAAVPLGFIPVGWYPTSVRWDGAHKRVLVANGKGARSLPNPGGPGPGAPDDRAHKDQYIAQLLKGSLTVLPFPDPATMRAYTHKAFAASPLKQDFGANLKSPVPLKHVIYVIKENRTYDQILGDIKGANGDPSLCLFPEAITPNHHKLAKDYVVFDNFYTDGEVSANGHEWSMAAYATDFVEKMWPLYYRGSNSMDYPAEGTYDAIARPAGGYLWDRAAAKGLSFLSLGEWVKNGATANDPATPSVPALAGHIDPLYRGFDLSYKDVQRVDRFEVDLKDWVAKKEMPSLVIVRLGNDHTMGTRPNQPTPQAFMADNDLALGRLVEDVSSSVFWKDTAIFVLEDDAQNGPDHVDAHRTVALLVSPYTKKGGVDSTLYSTSSALRTMELILGLAPMSQFDAAATPMFASFHLKPDLAPYTHLTPAASTAAVNPPTAFGASASAAMDFTREDANDENELNEIIWKSVNGANSAMPAPMHQAFYVPHVGGDADDDDDD